MRQLVLLVFFIVAGKLCALPSTCPLMSEIVPGSLGIDISTDTQLASGWLNISKQRLIHRKDLKNLPLVIKGARGAQERQLLCLSLAQSGFKQVSFLQQDAVVYKLTVDDLIALTNKNIEHFTWVLEAAHAEKIASYLGVIGYVEPQGYFQSVDANASSASCRDLILSEDNFNVYSAQLEALGDQFKRQGCAILILPSLDEIKDVLAFHDIANIKRNSPLERYRCD